MSLISTRMLIKGKSKQRIFWLVELTIIVLLENFRGDVDCATKEAITSLYRKRDRSCGTASVKCQRAEAFAFGRWSVRDCP